MTNGAYVLRELHAELDKIVLKKNPHFHDASNVKIDIVRYKPTRTARRLRRFEAGEVHSAPTSPPSRWPT